MVAPWPSWPWVRLWRASAPTGRRRRRPRPAVRSRRSPRTLPAPVVAAMQEGKYAEVVDRLRQADRRGQVSLGQVVLPVPPGDRRAAGREGGRRPGDPRRGPATRAQRAPGPPRSASSWPPSSWPPAGPTQAEALARLEAETLLEPERKDRLAEVYYAFARRLLTPDDPISKADPIQPPMPCSPRPENWPRGRPSAPRSCSRWPGPAR